MIYTYNPSTPKQVQRHTRVFYKRRSSDPRKFSQHCPPLNLSVWFYNYYIPINLLLFIFNKTYIHSFRNFTFNMLSEFLTWERSLIKSSPWNVDTEYDLVIVLLQQIKMVDCFRTGRKKKKDRFFRDGRNDFVSKWQTVTKKSESEILWRTPKLGLPWTKTMIERPIHRGIKVIPDSTWLGFRHGVTI